MFEKQSILLFSDQIGSSAHSLANLLSLNFKRKLVELGTGTTNYDLESLSLTEHFVNNMVREFDPVLVVFNYSSNNSAQRNKILKHLKAFRDLRVPYIGVKNGVEIGVLDNILIPVGFLPEEKEKAPWGNSFMKYCNSKITLLQPKDKGTRAKKNVEFIEKVFKSYNRNYQLIKGSKSSFKIEFESISKKEYDMYFITGSRAYGLDDVFFGPKEYHVLKKADKPVLIINPRDDIYVLCGD